MTRENLILNTLDALYVLHGEAVSIVDASTLARYLGVSPTRIAETLLHLESRGLVNADTARLTMTGLATAAALSAARATKHVAA